MWVHKQKIANEKKAQKKKCYTAVLLTAVHPYMRGSRGAHYAYGPYSSNEQEFQIVFGAIAAHRQSGAV